jgi:hypothetical protein
MQVVADITFRRGDLPLGTLLWDLLQIMCHKHILVADGEVCGIHQHLQRIDALCNDGQVPRSL